jgi:hypothetical protein
MVSFELTVAGVEWPVIGKMRFSVHQPMERSYPLGQPMEQKFFFRD